MTIVLNALPKGGSFAMTAASLATAGTLITVAVYGAVALIVKADDVGLHLFARGDSGFIPALGRGIVRAMPWVMKILAVVGTAAMVWVGGSNIVHGQHELGWHAPYDLIHASAISVARAAPGYQGVVEWIVTAFLDGVLGLILGLASIPVPNRVIGPIDLAIRLGPPGEMLDPENLVGKQKHPLQGSCR